MSNEGTRRDRKGQCLKLSLRKARDKGHTPIEVCPCPFLPRQRTKPDGNGQDSDPTANRRRPSPRPSPTPDGRPWQYPLF